MASPPIDDVPPSAKLVYKVLEYDGPLTQKAIVRESMLSQRTVRDALARLEEIDAIEDRVYVPDARQTLYQLSSQPAGEPAPAVEAGSD